MAEAKKKMGRPLRQFDENLLKNLCSVLCTVDEIESILETDQRTIDKWCQRENGETFSTFYKRHGQGGKASLRRIQFSLAKKNAAMAIWLGKQHLNQRDGDRDREKQMVHKAAAALIGAVNHIAGIEDEHAPKHETD